jgi:hypothetical protein
MSKIIEANDIELDETHFNETHFNEDGIKMLSYIMYNFIM